METITQNKVLESKTKDVENDWGGHLSHKGTDDTVIEIQAHSDKEAIEILCKARGVNDSKELQPAIIKWFVKVPEKRPKS